MNKTQVKEMKILKNNLEVMETMFPLQTIQSMAERWGVKRQTVNNWMLRHTDFPKSLDWAIAKTARTPSVFSNADMLNYERNHNLLSDADK